MPRKNLWECQEFLLEVAWSTELQTILYRIFYPCFFSGTNSNSFKWKCKQFSFGDLMEFKLNHWNLSSKMNHQYLWPKECAYASFKALIFQAGSVFQSVKWLDDHFKCATTCLRTSCLMILITCAHSSFPRKPLGNIIRKYLSGALQKNVVSRYFVMNWRGYIELKGRPLGITAL